MLKRERQMKIEEMTTEELTVVLSWEELGIFEDAIQNRLEYTTSEREQDPDIPAHPDMFVEYTVELKKLWEIHDTIKAAGAWKHSEEEKDR